MQIVLEKSLGTPATSPYIFVVRQCTNVRHLQTAKLPKATSHISRISEPNGGSTEEAKEPKTELSYENTSIKDADHDMRQKWIESGFKVD